MHLPKTKMQLTQLIATQYPFFFFLIKPLPAPHIFSQLKATFTSFPCSYPGCVTKFWPWDMNSMIYAAPGSCPLQRRLLSLLPFQSLQRGWNANTVLLSQPLLRVSWESNTSGNGGAGTPGTLCELMEQRSLPVLYLSPLNNYMREIMKYLSELLFVFLCYKSLDYTLIIHGLST